MCKLPQFWIVYWKVSLLNDYGQASMNNKNNNLSMMIFDDFRNCKEAWKSPKAISQNPGPPKQVHSSF